MWSEFLRRVERRSEVAETRARKAFEDAAQDQGKRGFETIQEFKARLDALVEEFYRVRVDDRWREGAQARGCAQGHTHTGRLACGHAMR